jgi:D-3-phosphoglycerate dehydrogenase
MTETLSANPVIRRLGVTAAAAGVPAAGKADVLRLYPNAKFNPLPGNPSEDQVIELLSDCDAAIVGLDPMSERVVSALPNLKIVGKFGAGYDTVDFQALKSRGILFGYKWGVNALPVAELSISFMISALRLVTPLNQSMRAGERPRLTMGRLLSGRTVGIHGCGHIGRELVRLLEPFNCEIIACDIRDRSAFYKAHGVTEVDFDTLLKRSEILSLHLAKSQLTTGMYSREVLAKLRPDCVLVNTCRGGIVDEDALLDALNEDRLAAACFDVFGIEPACNDELLNHRRMLSTPHIGAAIPEIREAMFRSAIQALVDCGPVNLDDYDV